MSPLPYPHGRPRHPEPAPNYVAALDAAIAKAQAETTAATPLDLDAIEGRARALTYALGRDHIGAVASFGRTLGDVDVPALVAEVRTLRAKVERAEDACRDWIDGADSDRFERHVASVILAAMDGPT